MLLGPKFIVVTDTRKIKKNGEKGLSTFGSLVKTKQKQKTQKKQLFKHLYKGNISIHSFCFSWKSVKKKKEWTFSRRYNQITVEKHHNNISTTSPDKKQKLVFKGAFQNNLNYNLFWTKRNRYHPCKLYYQSIFITKIKNL